MGSWWSWYYNNKLFIYSHQLNINERYRQKGRWQLEKGRRAFTLNQICRTIWSGQPGDCEHIYVLGSKQLMPGLPEKYLPFSVRPPPASKRKDSYPACQKGMLLQPYFSHVQLWILCSYKSQCLTIRWGLKKFFFKHAGLYHTKPVENKAVNQILNKYIWKSGPC